ncbi:MAG: hypothetical protein KatS3mg002_0326 [Candidatus Woesearchaeota archaeon]|nr:MAG: hypothetical protein KatS3mg002_0326 [Candidatus Woesearchaeota archaeon]
MIDKISPTIIRKAIEEAKKSSHKSHRLGAVIFSNGTKIISWGHNHSQRAARRVNSKYLKWPKTIHAEVDAILKSRTDLKRKKILVVRINNHDQFLLAKPCEWCQLYLKYVGIRHVYYSINKYPYIEYMRLI